MDLRELEYFQTVSRLKSFTGAARRLCISQPSITVAIKKLEEELGVSLFERNKKVVTLTSEGVLFLQRVDKILNDVNNALLEMKDIKNLKKQVIRLGLPPAAASPFLGAIFKEYKTDSSNLELIINECTPLDIVTLLEKEELDMGLIGLHNSSDLLEIKKVSTLEILVCLPPNHPLKDLPVIPFNLLRNESFILVEGNNNTRKMILEECEKHGFTPNIIFSSKIFENIKILVSSGIGISFLINPIASNGPNIICRSLESPLLIDIGLAWKKNKFLTKAQQDFINFMNNLSNSFSTSHKSF